MKKVIYFLFYFCLLAINTNAQEAKIEKIKAAKVAFITNELDLTASEAEKFWPLFNAFDDKQREIRQSKFKGFRERKQKDLEALSEKEAATILADMEKNEDDLHVLRKKFIASLKNIILSSKILKLKSAEEKFSRKLLQQYKEKRD